MKRTIQFESLAIQFLQDELPLLSYVEKTWIGAPVAGYRRLDPDFPLQIWNFLNKASTGSTRMIFDYIQQK